MADWLDLKDKVVVIIGAVGGMGTHFCEAFTEHGAKLVLVDIKKDTIQTAAKKLADQYDVQTLAVATDTQMKMKSMLRCKRLWLSLAKWTFS